MKAELQQQTRKFGKWQIVANHDYKVYSLPVVQHEGDPELLGVIKSLSQSNEAKTLEGLDHPNVVKLLDYDLEAGYMVTELCKGGTLQTANLAEWSLMDKISCHTQLCSGFAYLWEQGLTKGDHNFKNVFLKEDNTPVIGDFESAQKIGKDAEGVEKILHSASLMFWELMEEKELSQVFVEEQQLQGEPVQLYE